ncbi:transient receptor potential cation channel subfamily M member 2 [Ictalurus furcatus]|uniref:transient receptor potential cation channel subfamily M member 2 n=1 Tax=Ictalurus furcatus TaxID=66913 RepID=UPI0023501EEF|nr:transient receptor potential cation channel subfamily M member 2 [Ictalurus furcatus]
MSMEDGVQALSVCVAKSRYLSPSSSFQRCSFSSWIKVNIKKKECCFYVEDGRKEICMCGYPKPDHKDEAIKPEDYIGQQYDKHRHIREVPTDAYGDINFGGIGQKTGRYVRVSSDTPVEKLYQLMTDYWKLQPPNLLISVTGGAKNFDIKTDLKNKFRRGLIKVAQTTGAWILTGGTNTGVMKHVGRAVRDYNLSSNTVGGQIVAIGVATWGVIHNRQALVHPDGRFPAHYYLDEHCQGHLSCLDVNHSHFLLVDDGTSGKYGAEIELRGRLEKLISDQPLEKPESELKIPVVCVVLGGGPGTLNTIYSSMMNSSPCVVLEGSGRLADVLANVAGLPLSKITIALIQRLMKKFFTEEYNNFSELNIIEWTKKIQDIVQFPQLLTVFCIDEEKNNDVDVAILQAFLKAPRCGDSVNRERQLQLAVAWNRVDIAESEIFTEESKWKSCDLHQAMFSALVGHKAEFVRLLLENGLCIIQFLKDEKTLCDLYKHLPSCLFSRKLAKRAQGSMMITLSHVAAEVRRLLGRFTQPLYHPMPPPHKIEISSDDKDFTTTPKSQVEEPSCSGKERDPDTVCDAARDLFLWSVLQNQKDLAQITWEQCNDCIAAALAASKILKKLAQEGGDTGEEAGSMRELADHYEKQAIGVFSECHRYDKHRAQKLLTRVSPSWGSTTSLCVALEAHDKSFIAHPGVQALLTQIWCGELAVENPQWKLLLCMFFFPLIYTGFLVYRHDEVIRREAERTEEEKLDSVTGMSRNGRKKHDFCNQSDTSSVRPLNCWARLVGLYTCPQVKFYWNILFYFGFLFLYALVLITDFQPTPSWKELLLYVWLASLMFEEVRQLFYDFNGFTLWKKMNMYIKDSWNILDMLSILLFITGLVCRLQASSTVFYVGKIILCIDFIIFSLRLMAIFTISKILGPKIIIVRRMMMDMFFFLFLLSIWVVAYGVATQSILIENEDRINWIIRGAVYEPYLIIFGNLPDSVDNTKFDINSCSINGSDPLKPKCPVLNSDNSPAFPDWLTIIMLCIYLLFANILLLNLLIAIFNYTFQEVQDNTDIIWKFQRYELIKEYHSRPSLPPPFILLSHIYLFIRRVLLRRTPQKHMIFRQELDQTEDEELMSWESFMKENYLASLQQDSSQSMEHRLEITSEKVGTMSEIIEQGQEWGSVSKRLGLLEEQVCQSAKALQWIMDTLKSQGHQSKQDAPIMASVTITNTDPSESTEQEAEREKTYHVYARQLYYPGSNVKRFPVPLEKVPWEVDFSIYDPAIYNQENMQASDILTLDTYRNPKGRTGLKGQGAHKNLGPNEIIYPVITSSSQSGLSVLTSIINKAFLHTEPLLTGLVFPNFDYDTFRGLHCSSCYFVFCRNEGSQLQFLAVWDETERCWTFPGGPVQPGELLPEILETALGKNLSQEIKAKIKSGSHTEVCKGYVDDSRNTDNAWVESTVITVHLEDEWRLMMQGGGDESLSSTEKLEWQEVSGKTPVNPYQREALCTIAQKHNIKF